MPTNKEILVANNEKIEQLTDTLKNKILKAQEQGEYLVRVIDYDGTTLKEKWLNTGDAFELPEPPTNHERLIWQDWSSPVDIVDNQVVVEEQDIIIGAIYTTKSGLTEIDIMLNKVNAPNIETGGFVVTINIEGNKNWGDDTSDAETTHTYYAHGNYTITCDGLQIPDKVFAQTSSDRNNYVENIHFAGAVRFLGTGSYHHIGYCNLLKTITLPKDMSMIEGYTRFESYYNPLLKAIIIPNGAKQVGTAEGCYSLIHCVLPSTVRNTGTRQLCKASIKYFSFPKSLNYITNGFFEDFYNIENIKIPDTITQIGSRVFYGTNIKEIILPDNIQEITDAFIYCSYLSKIKMPSNVSNIKASAFSSCSVLLLYDFSKSIQVPTLANINAFNGINASAKIVVPDTLYDEWVLATNWTTYANYIYKASEVNL